MRNALPPVQYEASIPSPHGRPAAGTESFDGDELQSAGVNFRDILATLRRHLLLIALTTAVVGALAAFFVLRQPPVYRAQASLRLADMRKQLTGSLDDAAASKLMGQGTDPILSQIQVLESRGVAAEIVKEAPVGTRVLARRFAPGVVKVLEISPELAADTVHLEFGAREVTATTGDIKRVVPYGAPIAVPGLTFSIAQAPADAREGTLRTIDAEAAANFVASRLDARARRTTDVIDVTYQDSDPSAARQIVNSAVRVFQRYNAQTAQQISARRREFIAEQLQQTDSMLVGAQQALSEYRSRKQLFSSDGPAAAQTAGIMDLDIQRSQIDADRQTAQRLIRALGAEDRGPARSESVRSLVSSPSISSSPVVQQLYAQLVRYEQARDSLLVGGATRANPDVVRTSTVIDQTEERLSEAVQSYVTFLDARIAALDDLRARNLAAMQGIPQTQAEAARLTQRLETINKLADQLREEYQMARIAEAVEQGQVQILDLAVLPTKPIGVSNGIKLTVAVLVGLLAGMGLALGVEHMNTTVRSREDVERLLGVPSLAVIPRIETGNGHAGARARRLLGMGRGAAGNGNGASADKSDGSGLVVHGDNRSLGAEGYRTLRTNLIFSRTAGTLRTLVVTSATPSEGKTTSASNLASAFAQQGMRVLVVDCDLRRARLHEIFGATREPGLTQVLLGFAKLEAGVRPTSVPGLFVLPAGIIPPNPSELLGGSEMRALMEELSRQYDLVIYDTPPVMAAADSAILGTLVDGVVMVVRAGYADRNAARTALQQMRTVGARVLGVVLNDPDARLPKYGAYYYYNYEAYSAS